MSRLKILVFEYITGGGFSQVELPEKLAHEGLLMLQALVDLLAELNGVEALVMLDSRVIKKLRLPAHIALHVVEPKSDALSDFAQLLTLCDAVWPVAPESDNILQTLCRQIEQSDKVLLGSSANAVALTGNKWLTYRHLRDKGIHTVETVLLPDFLFHEGEWVIKPLDGAGSMETYVLATPQEYKARAASLDCARYIIQPHLQGKKTSLSCLFKQGNGWLLSINRQEFGYINQQYNLIGLSVNCEIDHDLYLSIVNQIAHVIPELWGYVGIDLIEHDEKIDVLEINPRLTTSFVGIKAATGLNCAQLTLDLLEGAPQIDPLYSRTIHLALQP